MFRVTFFKKNTSEKRFKILTVDGLIALQELKTYTITCVDIF